MLPLPTDPVAAKPIPPGQRLNTYRNLILQDPPRNVTLNPIAKLVIIVPLFLLWVFYLNLVVVLRHPRQTGELQMLALFAIPVLFAVLARVIIHTIAYRSLLRAGSYSIGTVVAKQKPGLWSFGKSMIAFEFPVGGHKPMTGHGFDWSGNLAQGKPVIVFYNPSDISSYVALVSTPWRVRTQSGELFRP
ncbi:MAG TPA: hypothetical protein VMJ35_10195 [Dongiaceae bacterium]|nr:hypothetical protein [Dongiaceae bacterium]